MLILAVRHISVSLRDCDPRSLEISRINDGRFGVLCRDVIAYRLAALVVLVKMEQGKATHCGRMLLKLFAYVSEQWKSGPVENERLTSATAVVSNVERSTQSMVLEYWNGRKHEESHVVKS